MNELISSNNNHQDSASAVRFVSWEDMKAALAYTDRSHSLSKSMPITPVAGTGDARNKQLDIDHNDLITTFQAGLLSPRTVHASIIKGHYVSIALQSIIPFEYAVQSLRCGPLVKMAINIRTGAWVIPWFDALPLSLLQFLFEDQSSLVRVRVAAKHKLEQVTPLQVRSGKTVSDRFNDIQRQLMDTGIILDIADMQLWVLYYLLHLPTVEMGLNAAFKEMATHCLVYLEENIYPAAKFLQTIQEIFERFQGLMEDVSNAMNVEMKISAVEQRFGKGLFLD